MDWAWIFCRSESQEPCWGCMRTADTNLDKKRCTWNRLMLLDWVMVPRWIRNKYANDLSLGVIFGRELVNSPANVLTPCQKILHQTLIVLHRFTVSILIAVILCPFSCACGGGVKDRFYLQWCVHCHNTRCREMKRVEDVFLLGSCYCVTNPWERQEKAGYCWEGFNFWKICTL